MQPNNVVPTSTQEHRFMAPKLKRGQNHCQQPARGDIIRGQCQVGMKQKVPSPCPLWCIRDRCNRRRQHTDVEMKGHKQKRSPGFGSFLPCSFLARNIFFFLPYFKFPLSAQDSIAVCLAAGCRHRYLLHPVSHRTSRGRVALPYIGCVFLKAV